MRRFHSYGPVDPRFHFSVPRRSLVEQCVEQLVGQPGEGGHYFTIWAPRQTGKTWLMRRAIDEIRARYGEQFAIGALSMEGLLGADSGEDDLLRCMPKIFRDGGFSFDREPPKTWEAWVELFEKGKGIFDRPTILLIDEFDTLPPPLIDALVRSFRRIYLNREAHHLHGLALIGVRAVLGATSPKGSPFNVQRTLQVTNLTAAEVVDLFDQYRAESGQVVEPEVPDRVFAATRGQPGLVGWLGELLTEKYNPGAGSPITPAVWHRVYRRACQAEWNNTILNLISKARAPHLAEVVKLFTDPNVPFSLDKGWCSYLYMNGIIDEGLAPADPDSPEGETSVCRFSSPFVQLRLYAALTGDMFGDKGPILAVEPGDTLSDVFAPEGLSMPLLLGRYRRYLDRLAKSGIDPWQGQPRRKDLHLTEAVGHFHLYAWLREAVGRRCTISPEFPTGNGKVDLVLRTRQHTALIEVKSFTDMYELGLGQAQAAAYAKKLGLAAATLAVFVPLPDAEVPPQLSGEKEIDGVRVITIALGWV